MIDENTIIKDESGNRVEMFKFMELMDSGEWTMDPVTDSEGKLQYMQLRKATEEEKKMMSQMPSSDLIGKSAPDFKMIDINGNTILSKNTKGKVVVLNFWFTSCKPCIYEIPELNEVYEKYKNDTNVIFASITFDKQEKVNSFLIKHPIKYPVVSDANEICDLFKISGYPTNIVIDMNGNYLKYIRGGFPQIGHQISNSIQNALDNKEATKNTIPTDSKMMDSSSVFKLENGETIPFDKVMNLLNSNNYDIVPQKDENNKEYYLLKKKKV
jgi:peroxiredoxin